MSISPLSWDPVGIRVVKLGDAYVPPGAISPDLEIIGLAVVGVEVTIRADPYFVFSTWIRRGVEPGNGEATGSCLQD